MRHKEENDSKYEPTDSLLEFEQKIHPITGEESIDVFLRYAPNKKVFVAFCLQKYDHKTDQMVYQPYVSGKELCPPIPNVGLLKEEIRKHEQTFIEKEIKYMEEQDWYPKTIIFSERLKEIDQKSMSQIEPSKEQADRKKELCQARTSQPKDHSRNR